MKNEEFHRKIVNYYKSTFEKRTGEKNTYDNKMNIQESQQKALSNEIEELKKGNTK